MGATFSQPTYFYDESTRPDLVDTNGPLYQRTAVDLGNLTPVTCTVKAHITSTGSTLDVVNVGSTGTIVTHDLHVTKGAFSPKSNNKESAIASVGLNGYVEFTGAIMPPAAVPDDSSVVYYTGTLSTAVFNAGGTTQAPIQVQAIDTQGYTYAGFASLMNSAADNTNLLFDGSTFNRVLFTLFPSPPNVRPSASNFAVLNLFRFY